MRLEAACLGHDNANRLKDLATGAISSSNWTRTRRKLGGCAGCWLFCALSLSVHFVRIFKVQHFLLATGKFDIRKNYFSGFRYTGYVSLAEVEGGDDGDDE